MSSFYAAVDAALASPLAKRRSLMTEGQVASDASSYEASSRSSLSNPPESGFIMAVAGDDAVALRSMLANIGSVNTRDFSGVPALHLAAARGHVLALRALLNEGVQVDLQGPGLRTALHVATDMGHVDVIRCLLEAGSDMEIKDRMGKTPLMQAVYGRRWQIARLLVEKGADPNAVFEGKSALMVAAAQGDFPTVELMLFHKKPCDVYEALSHAKNASVVRAFEHALPGVLREAGGKALFEAAKHGRLQSMVALLDAGVGVECKEEGTDMTALMWASQNGHVECVKELVRRKAPLDPVDWLRRTALHHASSKGGCITRLLKKKEVVRVLLDSGADATNIDIDFESPLELTLTEAFKFIFRNYSTRPK